MAYNRSRGRGRGRGSGGGKSRDPGHSNQTVPRSEMLSSIVDEGTEHDTFRRDRLESNTVKASFAVAQQALDRLTEHNWSSTADKILSVGWGTDEELAELAYMVVMKGLHSPHIIESCGEMAVTIMYSLPPDVMGRWRSPFFDTIQQAFETLLKSDTVPDGLVSPVEVTAKMSAMIDFLGHFFVCNIVTERILHACLQDLLRQPSDLRVEAAAHLLHITEPVIEHNLHAITGQPSGLQGRLYLRHYYDRIERWCLAGQMDAVVCHWIMDDVVRPRRIWERQQMKTVVPVTACSAKYGRAAAPRAAHICPGETLAAGRAVSEHSHGAPAEVARAAPTPGHLPAAHGGAVANGPVGVQPQETVIEESVPEELTAKKGSAVNLVPQDMCVMEVVPTIAKVKGTSGKGRAAQISKGRKREQPSSPGTPSPSSMKATLQQPTGEADTHAAAREWSMGDFACGRRRPSAVSASSTSSQHASDTCPASLIGKTTQDAAQPAVSSSALSVVSHSSAQRCVDSAGQDSVQDASPPCSISIFAMRKPVPSRVQTSQASSKESGNKSRNPNAANKTSSTSPNCPDFNARACCRPSSDCSDEYHSASSDAVELRSSRLSPHSSPSQASTDSYTTARSQTSSTDQASNNNSKSACTTGAAAAQVAVSSSTQGVKQASMALEQVPVPPAEQRHNANAERGQVSQVCQHGSLPPVRSQTAHVEPEQPTQAERQYMPQRIHQIKASSQASHLASAEPRQYAQAEHHPSPQDCMQTSRPYISPQTDNLKPLQDVPAECDSMSSMHPGVGGGVDPNEPAAQAGLDEQVHSLDDTLSNALQELLLTQDRQDFALSIQHLVSSNDDAHMLGCLLTASWHKLHGASWRPVIPSDVARLHLASAQERVTAAREGLQRVFRKAGSIDPGVYDHTDSPQLGPATNPRHRLPFKLHYSNRGYQMLLKQGWEEGKGLGHGAKGRADPHIPTHQCGRDAHLGLGCMQYKDILTGKAAEDEIRDAIFGLCSGPTAIFTMGALCEATAQFLTNVPQDSRAPPVEGLTWVSSCA
ncbi:TPA: hypothetical protein ACH3X2_006750 [Trebouxia sp. C0005]